jgi:hypothetical protein
MISRSKFWNHRSPRFWWGFWVLIFLFACWVWSCYFRFEIARQSAKGPRLELVISRGCLIVGSWNQAGIPGITPGWDFNSGKLIAFSGTPRFSRVDTPIGLFQQLRLPLWIPLPGWLILWPLWLRRARKKAGAILEEPHPAEIENS